MGKCQTDGIKPFRNYHKMFEINDILVSDELYESKFLCDLNSCKGACCVEGDSGAPLEEEECFKLDEIFDKVRPYMRPEGIEVVEKQGTFEIDQDDDLNLFTGFDIEFNPEFSFLIEYNAALNQNNMTAKTISLSNGGFLNSGLRFSVFENLHLELHFNNLLFDSPISKINSVLALSKYFK